MTVGHAAGCCLMQGLEKYLMTKIYHKTFGVSELDSERDEALSVRMAALSFVRPSAPGHPRAVPGREGLGAGHEGAAQDQQLQGLSLLCASSSNMTASTG